MTKQWQLHSRLEIGPDNFEVYYNNESLRRASKFTYLGVTLSANGKDFQAQKSLSEQAMKALFSLNSLFDAVSLDKREKLKLFDSMVLPILCYGCEVWGFPAAPDIERAHLKFLKQILAVKPQTCTNAVYGELGRVPLHVVRKERILKFCFKNIKNPNTLVYKALQEQVTNGFDGCWGLKVKQLLDDLGFSYLWNNSDITSLQLNLLLGHVYDQYYQSWYAELNQSHKLLYYNMIKSQVGLEKYLGCVTNNRQRIELTKFRCSAHRLAIEEGRYRNIDRNERICVHCNMGIVEDEYHF